jgi:probable HAF family extracellular repeat protein
MKHYRIAHSRLAFIALCIITSAFTTHVRGEAFFKPIGFLPNGDFSDVGGISPDGNVVVGESNTLAGAGNVLVDRAIRWESGLMSSLGFLDFEPIGSIGLDASFDGSIIVGTEIQSAGLGSTVVGWQWKAGVMTSLSLLPGGDSHRADAVSYDGRIIVGSADVGASFFNAARWVAGVPQDMGTGTNDVDDLSGSKGVSADGSIATGSSDFPLPDSGFHAFRHDGAFQNLGTLENIFVSNGLDISGDGQVVVGVSDIVNGVVEAFRWTGGVMTPLGDLSGGNIDSTANATNDDGSVIVGRGHTDVGDEAFLWSEQTGMLNIKDMLESAGLDLNGWTLTEAVAISADGNIFAGNGINPDGDMEGWVAAVPEPTSGILLGMGMIWRLRCRRSGRC